MKLIMKIRVDFEHYTFANNPLGEATIQKFIFLRIIGIIWGNNVCLENLGIEFWGVGKA